MNKRNTGTYRVGLFGVTVEIDYNSNEAWQLINFLFKDLPHEKALVSNRRFDLIMAGSPTRMSLWQDEKQLYFGKSKHALAYILINEMIYECITNSVRDQALHAAALVFKGKGILLPGKSGSGKSSLAAWLTSRGHTYLTDELVLVSSRGIMRAFTRPLSLAQKSIAALSLHMPLNQAECLIGRWGTMVPHRCLNPQWSGSTPRLAYIVFPHYKHHQPTTITKLTSAQSCLKLMSCYVNARSFNEHGFSELAGLARTAVSYELQFGRFSDVEDVLEQHLQPQS